jgi:hypothetical protein
MNPDWTRIVSFDPGETTGYVILEKVPDSPIWAVEKLGSFTSEELLEIPPLVDSCDLALYEQLQIFHHTINTMGLEIIGAIRLACAQKEVETRKRNPALLQGIRRWPLIFDFGIPNKHAMAALQHAIIYIGVDNVQGVRFNR